MNDIVGRLKEFREFLSGRSSLQGIWFGDPQIKRGLGMTYWWRSSHLPILTEAAQAIADLTAKNERLREALEPSGSTKAAYSGEFKFSITEYDDEMDEDYEREIAVPWITVKEIMKAISARAALQERKP